MKKNRLQSFSQKISEAKQDKENISYDLTIDWLKKTMKVKDQAHLSRIADVLVYGDITGILIKASMMIIDSLRIADEKGMQKIISEVFKFWDSNRINENYKDKDGNTVILADVFENEVDWEGMEGEWEISVTTTQGKFKLIADVVNNESYTKSMDGIISLWTAVYQHDKTKTLVAIFYTKDDDGWLDNAEVEEVKKSGKKYQYA